MRTISPAVDSIEPMPPSRRPVDRNAAHTSSRRSRISTGPHEWTRNAPGRLPKPTTAIFMHPDSMGPLKQVCGLMRFTGSIRSAAAAFASRCTGVPDAVWATTTVSIVARISAPSDSSVMPSDSSMCTWPGAVAPPCDPIAGTTNGSAPSSRSAARVPRSSSTRPLSPRDPAPTATVMPGVTASRNVRSAASRAALSTSATAGGDGTSSGYGCSSGTTRSGANGSSTPAATCSHDMHTTVGARPIGSVVASTRCRRPSDVSCV